MIWNAIYNGVKHLIFSGDILRAAINTAWIEEWSNAHPSAAFLVTVLLITLLLFLLIYITAAINCLFWGIRYCLRGTWLYDINIKRWKKRFIAIQNSPAFSWKIERLKKLFTQPTVKESFLTVQSKHNLSKMVIYTELERLSNELTREDIVATSTFGIKPPFWGKKRGNDQFSFKPNPLKHIACQQEYERCISPLHPIREFKPHLFHGYCCNNCGNSNYIFLKTSFEREIVFFGIEASLHNVTMIFVVCLDCGKYIDSY